MDQLKWIIEENPLLFKSVVSVLVALALWGIMGFILRVLHKQIEDIQLYHKIKKALNIVTFTIFLVVMLFYWSYSMGSMSTFLGLFSAGIAIALKDLIVNLAAWLFIVTRKPFKVGDRIQVGEISGDVIDLRIFQFSLMEIGNWVDGDQSTGRVIHVPNAKILSVPMANFSQGFQYIWNEIHVLITFESDWEKAKELISQIVYQRTEHLSTEAEELVRKASKRYMIHYKKLTPIVYTSVKDSGVQLSIRYLCKPRKRRTSVQELWETILKEFAHHEDIDLAYSTQRVVMTKDGTQTGSKTNCQ